MHKHYKVDEIALKNLIRNNVFLTDSNNKIKLIIDYFKINEINLVISKNFSPSTNHRGRTNLVYEFKCQLGEYFSYKISTYIGQTISV